MPSITFMQGTVVPAVWLNDVDNAVFNTIPTLAPKVSPSFTTPSLGVATAISINGVAFSPATLSGTNTGDQLTFKNVAVTGQSTIVADTISDTLTVNAGTGISITTNATTDTMTIASSITQGALVLVATYNVIGGESAIDFLNVFTSTYDDYTIRLEGLTTVGAANFQAVAAIGGVANTSAIYYNTTTAGNAIPITNVTMSANGRGCTGSLNFNNVNSLTGLKTGMAAAAWEAVSGTDFRTQSGVPYGIVTGSALSGFRIVPTGAATTFVRGVIRVYGYANT